MIKGETGGKKKRSNGGRLQEDLVLHFWKYISMGFIENHPKAGGGGGAADRR